MTLLTHVMLLVILLGFILFILPRYQEVLEDLEVELPLVTQKVTAMAWWVQSHLSAAVGAALLFLTGDLLVYLRLRRSGHRALAFFWSTAILLAEAGAILISFAAVILPVYFANLKELAGS